MATAAHYHQASSLSNPIRSNTNNDQTHVGLGFAMRFRPDRSLKRVSANTSILNVNRFRNSRIFCLNAIPEQMETINNQESMKENTKKKEEEQQDISKKILPPPPEKPEPGDCCGSGCVRCVWDVYYEELEVYNNLHKTDSTNAK